MNPIILNFIIPVASFIINIYMIHSNLYIPNFFLFKFLIFLSFISYCILIIYEFMFDH